MNTIITNSIWIFLILCNSALFCLMGIDKVLAMCGLYRISERVLLTIGRYGGGIGGLFAMFLFRHKTLHPQFKKVFITNAVIVLIISMVLYFINH